MSIGLTSHLAQLLNGLVRRGHIRTSNGQADDILTLCIQLRYLLQFAAEVVFLHQTQSVCWFNSFVCHLDILLKS